MEASVLDLRKKMRNVMSAIDRRERVTLTYRGKRRAVIVPITESRKKPVLVADLTAFGMWAGRDDMADPITYVENLRKPRSR